jgi:hypothetical protein
MGWGNCGTDSKGRKIGYYFTAKCDHKGCKRKIHRGLAYACGGDHGEGQFYCEGYFCEHHLRVAEPEQDECFQLCPACFKVADKLEDERERETIARIEAEVD